MRTHRLIAVSALTLVAATTALATSIGSRSLAGASTKALSTTKRPVELLGAESRSHSPFLALTTDEVQAAKPPSGPPLEMYVFLNYLTAEKAWYSAVAWLTTVSQSETTQPSNVPSVHHSVSTYRSGGGGGGGGGGGDQFAAIRQCESGGNYSTNTGNGFYGAYQFSASTWHSLGYAGLPSDAPPSVQDQAAQQLASRSGFGQWPVCGHR